MAVVVWAVALVISSRAVAEPLEPGAYVGSVKLVTDVFDGRWGSWALAEIEAGEVFVELDDDLGLGRGDSFTAQGVVEGSPGSAAGHLYRATLDIRQLGDVEHSEFLPHRLGRFIRSTVMDRLEPLDSGRALLAGFLIGDTSGVAVSDVEAMRRSGLAHFVAVSGSNVALFLSLLFVVVGPLALGARRRAVIGLLGLPLYAAATLFEPSVMRASVMAGIALTGRLFDVVLEAWQLLSLAVVVLLVMEPGLSLNLGFQLSVAATAGVLVGARWPARNQIERALLITMGAQVAVAPLLLAAFGQVPLLSPLINLVAAPIVAAATVVGAVGVGGVGVLVGPAAWLADLVMDLARGAAPWPQMGTIPLLACLVCSGVVTLIPKLRPVLVVATTGLVVATTFFSGGRLESGEVAVLDVGQGDSILLYGGEGHYALVDGGPDAALLARKLQDYRVPHLDLMVLTHVHADHATGLAGALGQVDVERVWMDVEPHETPASLSLLEELEARAIQPTAPTPGDRFALGSLELIVVGPVRRYASPNDQSVVLRVEGSAKTMLLTGDIETFAQADLTGMHVDVLKVPHQGGATSDLGWLADVHPELAVISVGPNQFGHPSKEVIDTLARSGATVVRTDEAGDVVVDLS